MPSVLANVDWDELDTDEMIEELATRGFRLISEYEPPDDLKPALLRLFELFRTDEAEAIVQTKIFLQDKTGRIL